MNNCCTLYLELVAIASEQPEAQSSRIKYQNSRLNNILYSMLILSVLSLCLSGYISRYLCMRLCSWACSHWLGIRSLTLTFLSIFMPHILICHMYWHPPPGGTRLHLMLSLNNIPFISPLDLCTTNIHLIWLTQNHVMSKQF